MICNNRPFYAEYKNGNVSYELNGWSWLRDSAAWDELKDCDFYDTERTLDGFNLEFFCPYDFKSDVLTVKTYEFKLSDWKMEKINESNFADMIKDGIIQIHPSLKDCELLNLTAAKTPWPQVEVIFNCSSLNYKFVVSDLITLSFPVLENSEIKTREKYENIFEKFFKDDNSLQISQDETAMTIVSKSGNITFAGFMWIDSGKEIKETINDIGKFFIFPPLKEMKNITFVKEIETDFAKFRIYKIDNNIIRVMMNFGRISGFLRTLEWYNE
jgi:hypothetical protein